MPTVPANTDILGWLRANIADAHVPASETGDFVKVLSQTPHLSSISGPKDHLFTLISVLSMHGEFDSATLSEPHLVAIPSFNDGKIQGIKLQSGSGGFSLYLFFGSTNDLNAFQGTFYRMTNTGNFDPTYPLERWKSVRSRFKPDDRFVLPIQIATVGRFNFIPTPNGQRSLAYSKVFGATISPSYNAAQGMSQVAMRICNSKLTFVAISGLEGSDEPVNEIIDRVPITDGIPINASTNFMYFLEDAKTQVILGFGREI